MSNGFTWWMFVHRILKNLFSLLMYLLDYFTVFKIVAFSPHLKLISFFIILPQCVKPNNIFFLTTSYKLKYCYQVSSIVFSLLDSTNLILSAFLNHIFKTSNHSCSVLDSFQFVYILLVGWCPELCTIFQLRSDQ